jgi:hypothetical protein
MTDDPLVPVFEVARMLQDQDFVEHVAFCYNAGHYTVRGIVAALQRRGLLPRQPSAETIDLEILAELEEAAKKIRGMIAWPVKTPEGRMFWQAVEEGRQEGNETRYVGKVALKAMCRSLETVLELASAGNDDKRTRTQNAHYHLGALGFSPLQKHELAAGDALIRMAREVFAPPKELSEDAESGPAGGAADCPE